jgi:DsbC/DsbD-like thiol-disulfide interchange protein
MFRKFLVVSAAAAVAAAPLGASQPGDDDHPAEARLTAEHATLTAGGTAMLGIAFEIDEGWHLYWRGVNDSGFAPEVNLTLPPGYEAGEILWPAPKRKITELWEGEDGSILDHTYERRVLLMIPVRVPPDAEAGQEAKFHAALDWLICDEVCIPGSAEVSLSLPVAGADSGQPAPGPDARLFADARKRLPRPLPIEDPPLTIERKGDAFIVAAASPGTRKIAFYPALECAKLASVIEDGEARGDRLTLRLAESDDTASGLIGVVEIWSAPATSTVWQIDTYANQAAPETATASPLSTD